MPAHTKEDDGHVGSTTKFTEICEHFDQLYGRTQSPVTRDIERDVIGGDWGANGYTTMVEADILSRELQLAAGVRLLDLGAGRGWPGLYLTSRTGCTTVMVDPPVGGLEIAIARAKHEQLAQRAVAVAAAADAMPLRSRSVDAIVHTDVLCCLSAKHAALRTCWRLLRPGGRMAFTVIHVSPGLGARDRRRATTVGPPAVATRSSYAAMLASTGFVEVREHDRTSEFAIVAAGWIEQRERHRPHLEELFGKDDFDQRQSGNEAQLQAVRDGLLRRSIFTARRP